CQPGPELAPYLPGWGAFPRLEAAMQATPIDELRKPHPDQQRIDALSAQTLRATALEVLRRKQVDLRPGTSAPMGSLPRQ
ncbi:MAG: hypothetical protein MUO23_01890, partial [Anaerolineales bacterium]|nr:hypothetical protein [Anaerolineales bacterium]